MKLQELKQTLNTQFETLKRNKLSQAKLEPNATGSKKQSESNNGSVKVSNLEFLLKKENRPKPIATTEQKLERREFVKTILFLLTINLSAKFGNSAFRIALEDVGLASIVTTGAILEPTKLVGNLFVVFFFDRWSRRRALIAFNSVMASIGFAFVAISVCVGYTRARSLNMVLSFCMKTTLILSSMMSDLFLGILLNFESVLISS